MCFLFCFNYTIAVIQTTPQSVLLQLLLGSELVGTSALFLAAIGRAGRETSVAFAADLLLAVVLAGESSKSGVHGSSSET